MEQTYLEALVVVRRDGEWTYYRWSLLAQGS